MPGGDLRATALTVEALERLAERQARLRGVPPPGHSRRHRLTPADFDAEAVEAQRARARPRQSIPMRIALLLPEAVTRLTGAAPGTQPDSAGIGGA